MPNIIIENGALNIRVGYENSQQPNLIFQNKIALMPNRNFFDFSNNYLCGEDVDLLEGIYNVKQPISNGKIEDWQSMETIWKELMVKIGLSTSDDNISSHVYSDIYFLTSVNYNLSCYNRILDFFFLNYGINKIGFGLDAINALQSTGKKSGIVVDSGDSLTKIVPILEGYVDPKMIWQSQVAGKTVSNKIKQNILSTLGEPIHAQSSIDFLKDKYFFHKLHEEKKSSTIMEIVELPDGTSVHLGSERYRFPDLIFDDNSPGCSFVNGYFLTLDGLDRESKQLIAQSTLLVGGNTKTFNFEKKFLEEAQKVNQKSGIVTLKCANPLIASFQGSSANVFNLNETSQSVTKSEYDEFGTGIILRKKIPLLY